MNKRLLAGVAAAGIIGGGVYGFAATLGLTTDAVGANNILVASCDSSVDLDYTVAWDATDKVYEIDTVIVRGIHADCANDTIKVTLADVADVALGEEENLTVTAGDMTFNFAGDDVNAKTFEKAHVVIAGGDA